MNTLHAGSALKLHCVFSFSLLLVLCISSCIWSMDSSVPWDVVFNIRTKVLQAVLDKKRPFVNKQSCISKQESYGKVFSVANVREVEYLNDRQIAVTMDEEKHFMIDLHSSEQWEFSKPFMTLNCAVPMPENTEKVLNWGSDGCAQVRISNGFPYNKSNNHDFGYNGLFLPLYLDEKQSPLIWVKKNTYSLKWWQSDSYTYDINIYRSVYHSSLDPDGFISKCKEKFKTYYDLSQLVFDNEYLASPRRIIDVYSIDRSFIIKYGPKTSYYNALCTISYSDKREINNINVPIEEICSIALHPMVNDIFALMLSKNRTIQYWNSQGVLCAEQKRSIIDRGNVEKEVSSFAQYLAFSPDGIHLAALFPEQEEIVIFNVPFRVHIDPKKLIFILFCLKNQKMLPPDIVGLLCDIFSS